MRLISLIKAGVVLLLATSTVLTGNAAVTVSEIPMFLRAGATPNIVMTLDDSGSMERGYVPDTIGDASTKLNSPRFTAASYNALYYNPKVTYTVPKRTDGVTYSTSFTQAYVNGFDTGKGFVDLSANGYRPIYKCEPGQSKSTCVDSSHSTAGAGSGSTSSRSYSYTCKAFFDDRGNGNKDRIQVSSCSPSMPASGDGSPQEADSSTITVTGAVSPYSKNYVVDTSEEKNGGIRITLNSSNQISRDSDNPLNNVTLAWTETTSTTTSAGPAYYHLYYTDKTGAAKPTGCDNSKETNACYIYVKVGSSDDITTGDVAAQKQNFANWYSFYRSRALTAMSAAMTAVSGLGANQVRLGWQTLNNGGCTSFGTSCKGYDSVSHENRIRTLDAMKTGSSSVTHRTDFYDWIARLDIGSTTPLRGALKKAGEYFKTSGVDSPYAQEPYTTLGTELSCRRNFHVMLTDGLWNANNDTDYGGNVDSTAKTLPDSKSYVPRYPYQNGGTAPSGLSFSNNLADIAFTYWSTDLRSNLTNNLKPYTVDTSGSADAQYWNPKNNPATWQHMVNFNISFGLGSVLIDPIWGGSTYAGDYAALTNGTKYWPATDEAPAANDEPVGHVYDLWHAAINSRGQFFNADDPQGISNAFQSAFKTILNSNPSSAALAANSTSIQGGTLVYQARFDSADWHGQLLAYTVNSDGTVGSQQWDAASKIPAFGSRNITTWNGSAGKSLSDCSTNSMAADQKALLDKDANGTTDNKCAARVAWLRGDPAQEKRNGGLFRNRPVTVLGDIINSDPAYVKNEDYGYASSAMAESSSYAAFVAAKSSRTPMVYVGANDGMLHAFRADTGNTASGVEVFAHIPKGVYDRLSALTLPDTYTHKYYVDGAPTVGDAYWGGSWKTVLVGGLAAGGKSIFAIDITNPDAHGPAKVLWEFTDSELGLTYSQPQIARLSNGKWAAIFGNGYNSTSDKAYLFIVDLQTGGLIKKIKVSDATGNGLSTPALYDANNDKITDYVYAGDLKGNMWKFDMASILATTGTDVTAGTVLFSAVNASNQAQPITTKPALAKPTAQPATGVMVLFGTGMYVSDTDTASTRVDSFYGIWDNGTAGVVSKASLQRQTIASETTSYAYDVRTTSANAIDWSTQRGWYMDLVGPNVAATGPGGERVVSQPIVRYDRVIFVTTIPSADQCEAGGTSWLMEIDLATGARTTIPMFDLNGDGFNASDLLANGGVVSGVKSKEGILKTPAWLEQGKSSEIAIKQMSGSSGGIFVVRNRKPATSGSVRRVFWQQLR